MREDLLASILFGLLIAIFVAFLGFIVYVGYAHATGIHEGEIYRKEYSAAYETTDSHTVTNGKTTTTYYTPRHIDATYRLLIRARGDDGKEQTNWFDVPKDVWDGAKVGQWYNDNCVCIEGR